VEVSDGVLKIELPPFYRDVACKINAVGGESESASP
jgi:hypothetical protein